MNEKQESFDQFAAAWRGFVGPVAGRELATEPGLEIIWSNTPTMVYNALFATGRLVDVAERAAAYMKSKPMPGMLVICEDHEPDAAAILKHYDLAPAIPLTGMVADGLLPPARELPELEFRRVQDSETAWAISDINSHGYGCPTEFGRDSVANTASWGPKTWGYVGYLEGRPVACGAAYPIDGRLYVGLVATEPDVQRKGYAEAAMRHALAEAGAATGLTRTVLHATNAGYAVYRRMGYRDTARFMACLPAAF